MRGLTDSDRFGLPGCHFTPRGNVTTGRTQWPANRLPLPEAEIRIKMGSFAEFSRKKRQGIDE